MVRQKAVTLVVTMVACTVAATAVLKVLKSVVGKGLKRVELKEHM